MLPFISLYQYEVVKAEISGGREVGGLVGWNGEKSSSAEGVYPGARALQPYELDPPSMENFNRYTLESIVFSFVLLSALGALFSGALK